jgi:Zn-dependent protease with chaperone function
VGASPALAPAVRQDFRAAQRRHRIEARLRAIPAVLAAALMGVPLSVYFSPVLLAVVVLAVDLVNLVIPMPDLGGRIVAILRDLFLGGPEAVRAITWLALVWLLPGLIGLIAIYLVIRRRLRAIGGETIARSLKVRPRRTSDAAEDRLGNIVAEYSLAAGIRPPTIAIVGRGTLNATVYGRDPDTATLIVGRRLVDELDREATQGAVARLVGSAVDGDLGLATTVGAVYVTYGLLTTALSAVVSPGARVRLRGAIRALRGRAPDASTDAALSALVGLPIDDDFDRERGRGYVSIVTMSGVIGAAISMVNLFLAGPLLVLAWRSRVGLADAVAVELTRNPTALARALHTVGEGRGMPGSGWLELLLVAGGGPSQRTDERHGRALSDTAMISSIAPSIAERIARLQAMGADGAIAGGPSRRHRLNSRYVVAVALTIAYHLFGVLATAGLVVLIGIFASFPLFVVIFPVNDFLRGLAGS